MDINAVTASYGKTYNPNKSGNKSVPAKNASNISDVKVEISDQSSQLQKLKAIVDQEPEVRLAVVKVIKARIKNNDYPIANNLDELVKKMIQNTILKS